LRFVKGTNRIRFLPEDVYSPVEGNQPVILTMWHGQHFMQTFYRKPWHRCHIMISRHGDGEINAAAAESLGMLVVRGSGAQRSDQIRKRGGIGALRTLLGLLKAGEHVSMTADVPKVSRVAGEGIIALAQMSGRPIIPVTAVCSRRIDFASWDCASVGLPFGTTVISIGNALTVPVDADAAGREAARQALEIELDRLYEAAYGALGQADPGGGRESVHRARAQKHQEAQIAIAAAAERTRSSQA
jgi:lysophospholipid acyltransferase (LPLAT)-like uncharacterized protein